MAFKTNSVFYSFPKTGHIPLQTGEKQDPGIYNPKTEFIKTNEPVWSFSKSKRDD